MATKRPASASEIVERFGMSERSTRGTAGKQPPVHRRKLEARDDKILAMREQGKTWGEIGDRFGISVSAAHTAAKRSRRRAEGPTAQDAVGPHLADTVRGTSKPSRE